MFQCVENAQKVIGEKFEDYCESIFPNQKRASSVLQTKAVVTQKLLQHSHEAPVHVDDLAAAVFSERISTGQLKLGRSRTRADSELQCHRTTLNFAGAQCDYFIIMITTVPVRSYGPIYSSIYSYP